MTKTNEKIREKIVDRFPELKENESVGDNQIKHG